MDIEKSPATNQLDTVLYLDSRTAAQIQAEEDAHIGVKTSQAAYKIYGKYSKWSLFAGCVFYIYRSCYHDRLNVGSVLDFRHTYIRWTALRRFHI